MTVAVVFTERPVAAIPLNSAWCAPRTVIRATTEPQLNLLKDRFDLRQETLRSDDGSQLGLQHLERDLQTISQDLGVPRFDRYWVGDDWRSGFDPDFVHFVEEAAGRTR